jgi:hypothetical protein
MAVSMGNVCDSDLVAAKELASGSCSRELAVKVYEALKRADEDIRQLIDSHAVMVEKLSHYERRNQFTNKP